MNYTVLATLVGLPYAERGRTAAGVDCWGLVLLAARKLWDIELPEYFYTQAQLLEDACGLIDTETHGPHWREVAAPFPGACVHIFRVLGRPTHCGIHLEQGSPLFLHSLPGRNSCIENLDDINWRQRRVGSYVLQ